MHAVANMSFMVISVVIDRRYKCLGIPERYFLSLSLSMSPNHLLLLWAPGIRQQFTDDFFNFGVIEIPAADGPVDNLSLCVQQQRCRKAIDAEALCNLTVRVKQNGKAGFNRQL